MIHWAASPDKRRQILLALGDGAIILFVLLAAWLLQESRGRQLWLTGAAGDLGLAAFVLVGQICTFYVFNLYDISDRRYRRLRGILTLFAGVLLMVLVAASILYFANDRGPGRVVLLTYLVGGIVGAHLWRVLFFSQFLKVERPARVGILGDDPAALALIANIEESAVKGYQIVAVIRENGPAGTPPGIKQYKLSSPEQLKAIIREADLDLLVYSILGNLSAEALEAALRECIEGARVVALPTFEGHLIGRYSVEAVDARWVLETLEGAVSPTPLEKLGRLIQLAAAAMLLLLTAPLMLLIAVGVRLDSPGPILFRQQRLGRWERPFTLLKFRTMADGAEAETGPTWASAGDERVTRFGHFLRRTGLDELPQLLNILRGEMAFVGPRPIRRHFASLLAEKIRFYRLRFVLRPGLTGWAQVRHNYAGSVEGQKRKFEYELFHVRNASLLLDAVIFLKTVQKLISRRVGDASAAAPPPLSEKRTASTSSDTGTEPRPGAEKALPNAR